MNPILFAAAALIVAASADGPRAQTAPLDAAAVQTLFSDAVGTGRAANRKTYTARYEPDGAASMRMDDYSFSDTGKWTVEEGRFCAQWEKIRNGAKACWEVFARDGNDYLLKGVNGADDIKATIRKE